MRSVKHLVAVLRRCWLMEINNKKAVVAAPFWLCKVDYFSLSHLSLLHVRQMSGHLGQVAHHQAAW